MIICNSSLCCDSLVPPADLDYLTSTNLDLEGHNHTIGIHFFTFPFFFTAGPTQCDSSVPAAHLTAGEKKYPQLLDFTSTYFVSLSLPLVSSHLQAVVVQQDVCVENQRQALDDWQATISSTVSSTSSLLSSSSSRSSTLTEQGKHKSLEMQRQEAASLQVHSV